jgi:hypothetical protein
LFAWTARTGEVRGWVAAPVTIGGSSSTLLHPDHLTLLSRFGGIDEYWETPSSLLNNLCGALRTSDACCWKGPLSEQVESTLAIFDAIEANGDYFVYHRETGEVILVGYDSGRGNKLPIPKQQNLLYHMKKAPTLQAWIEGVAADWSQDLAFDGD